MKFSENWLREWVNPDVSTDKLVEQLTMAGLEVDDVEPAAAEFTGIVVAEVKTVEPHPDADKLRVTTVDVGEDELVGIVCGASNVAVGIKVPCAKVGAVLPGNFKIKKAKLRGVPSLGMLCSESEMGLADSSEGLMILPADAPVGTDIREYLNLDDSVIDVDLTPNRADCFSLRGVAREVATINELEFNELMPKQTEPAHDDAIDVYLNAGEAAPIYAGCVLKDVNTQATTPLWMVEKLRRSGIRSLGIVVDVTNYVMIELGQPMHAFDLDTLQGGIGVRMSNKGEKLTLLDEREVELDDDTLVIADDRGPIAMAGIMGGLDTSVTDSTKNIFLEAAHFAPLALAGRARRYNMHTDSSMRFERGVDFNLPGVAMQRAVELLVELAGAKAGPVAMDRDVMAQPKRDVVPLRREKLINLMGIELADEKVFDILARLGLNPEVTNEGWQVHAPSFRFDIAIEEDLVEEVARIYGYSNFPAQAVSATMRIEPQTETQLPLMRSKQLLVDRGYFEAITYSFVDESTQATVNTGVKSVALQNPISAELAEMRTSLWTGLIKTLVHNQNRQQTRMRYFETGLRFVDSGEGDGIMARMQQEKMLAGIVTGDYLPEQWSNEARKVDFFDVKGDVEALLAQTQDMTQIRFVPSEHEALHPGQSAEIFAGETWLGRMGAIHPNVQKELGIDTQTFVFELKAEAVESAHVPSFKAISKFPEVRRDLAVIVSEETAVQGLVAAIRDAGGDDVARVSVFDVYQGKGIDDGYKSIAMAMHLQGKDQTWVDEEIHAVMDKVMQGLKDIGAQVRDS